MTLDGGTTGDVTLSGALSGGGNLHVLDGNVQTYAAITMDNVTIDDATTSVTFGGVQTLTGQSDVTSGGTIDLNANLTAGTTVTFRAAGNITINADLQAGRERSCWRAARMAAGT